MQKHEFPNLLPAGFHEFNIVDLAALCVTPFATSHRRSLLLNGLLAFIKEVTNIGIAGELWFDGSFITQKVDPDDVDLLVVFDGKTMNQLSVAHQNSVKRLFDPAYAKSHYNCDVYSVPSDDMVMVSYWRGWFGFQRDGKSPKGIAWIKL